MRGKRGRAGLTGPTPASARRPGRCAAAAKRPPFNPGPRYTDGIRRSGAALINAGRFRIADNGKRNTVLISAADGSGVQRTYRATARPARCQCAAFKANRACPHVLAAMIVRAAGACQVLPQAPRAAKRGSSS